MTIENFMSREKSSPTDSRVERCFHAVAPPTTRAKLLIIATAILVAGAPQFALAQTWSAWLNRDTPGGKGDYETIAGFKADGKIPCDAPLAIECRFASSLHKPITNGSPAGYTCNTAQGGYCEHKPGLRCQDMEVRFSCPATCVNPPSVCPTGHAQIGSFTSPGTPGWGKGTFAVCLEAPQTVTASFCSAAFHPGADHKCDDYKGYSTITSFGGKNYCVYERTNSTYFKALEIQ